MKRVVLLREARSDLSEARKWYEGQRKGLGKELLDRVAETLKSISRFPDAFQRVEGSDARVHLVSGFPYMILFRVETDRVVVFAVIHTSRDPGVWQSRI
ncbi:MAG TPA: type II toxin-antitoxin system RelE/ParE family toxin [Planctomycetaceae bacterium]